MNVNSPLLTGAVGYGLGYATAKVISPEPLTWAGRSRLYTVKNILLVTGSFCGFVAASEFTHPNEETSVSGWVIGTVAAAISIITFSGGIFLWRAIPHKKYEEAIESLNRNIQKVEKEKDELNERLSKVVIENENFKNSIDEAKENYRDLERRFAESTEIWKARELEIKESVAVAQNVTNKFQKTAQNFSTERRRFEELVSEPVLLPVPPDDKNDQGVQLLAFLDEEKERFEKANSKED